MGTITLELLREGPPHNQLLSPITPYIALAGNRPAETVYIPVEHAQMLARLRRLRYEASQPASAADLREAAQVVTRFLESIRGLAEAIAEHRATDGVQQKEPLQRARDVRAAQPFDASDDAHDRETHHLRLVISADELAMLPFELAQGALVQGGSDMLSVLHPPPVVITRESRRVPSSQFDWPRNPKILFVAADPERRGLPLEASLLALRAAVDPLLPLDPVGGDHEASNGKTGAAKAFQERVTVLLGASLDDVRRECASGKYTHVHVLAHGKMPQSLDGRPTVLFHRVTGARDADDVRGERLAAALRAPCEGCDGRSSPVVVTLAICDAGNQGSVLFAGGSVAHAIHDAGVPLVVASQFPLTFPGAVLMTQVMYARLLNREDPRVALADVRHRLFSELGRTHDWAAVIAYASLPNDLHKRLQEARYLALRGRIDVVMAAIDSPDSKLQEPLSKEDPRMRDLNTALAALQAHVNRLQGAERQSGLAKLGSAYKRRARLFHGGKPQGEAPQKKSAGDAVTNARLDMQRSMECYREYIRHGTSEAWPYVQLVSLMGLLGVREDGVAAKTDDTREWWHVARKFAHEQLLRPQSEPERLDTLASLTELSLLGWRFDFQPEPDARVEVRVRSDEVVRLLRRSPSEANMRKAYFHLRQLNRYLNWWWAFDGQQPSLSVGEKKVLERVLELVEELVANLVKAGVPTNYLPDNDDP